MYLLIDNYDSFTYNLYQAFASCGIDLTVKRNNQISLDDVEALHPEKIIISPGPKTPEHSGISVDLINRFAPKIPILGICLGHQCIAAAFGGNLIRVNKVLHGKQSKIYHEEKGIFYGIPSPFLAARYHSLEVANLPPSLNTIAQTDDNIIMGLEHREYPLVGLQFHPESFLTDHGQRIIKNFTEMNTNEKVLTRNR